MQYEIDEFEKIKIELEENFSEEEINLYKEYLGYKKEILTDYISCAYNSYEVPVQTIENLINEYFYRYIVNMKLNETDKDGNLVATHIMDKPPIIEIDPQKQIFGCGAFSQPILDEIRYLVEDLGFNKTFQTIERIYKFLNPDKQFLSSINLANVYDASILASNNNFIGMGYFSLTTFFFLLLSIFYNKFKIPFDSIEAMDFWCLWNNFYDCMNDFSYNLEENKVLVHPAIGLNSENK